MAVNDEPADEADFPGIVSYTFPTAAEAEIIIFIAGNGPGLPSATVLDVGCQQTGQRPPFQMNLGLNDVWFDDNIPGQGVMITIYPSIHFVFLAIFVFDLERPDPETPFEIGDPGHRWLTAFGNYEDNQADLEIELTSGGVFLDTNILPSQIEDGSMNIEFSDCQNATLHYDIASANLQGTIELTRIANDRVGLCEAMRDPSDD